LKPLHNAKFRFVKELSIDHQEIHPAHESCGYEVEDIQNNRPLFKEAQCSSNTLDAQNKWVLFGDSHASHLFPSFSTLRGASVHLMVSSSCPALFGDYKMQQRRRPIARCSAFAKYAEATILGDSTISTVILSMRASQYTETTDNEEPQVRTFLTDQLSDEQSVDNSRRVFSQTLNNTIDRLQSAGKRVVIVGQVPMLKKDPQRCLQNNRVLISKLFPIPEDHCFELDWAFVERRLRYSSNLYKELAASKKIILAEPRDVIKTTRPSGHLIYYDDNHINERGAQLLGEKLGFYKLAQ
jgi:hypothetical protein